MLGGFCQHQARDQELRGDAQRAFLGLQVSTRHQAPVDLGGLQQRLLLGIKLDILPAWCRVLHLRMVNGSVPIRVVSCQSLLPTRELTKPRTGLLQHLGTAGRIHWTLGDVRGKQRCGE
jgi:hypothetical protein